MAKLAIDIGNTNTHLAVFNNGRIVKKMNFPTAEKDKAAQYLKKVLREFTKSISGIGISSVNPKTNKYWLKAVRNISKSKPLLITHRIKLPLKIKVKKAETLGSDRICNAVCGYELFKGKENVIIISLGTAITLDVVLKNGDFIGGMIAPGLHTSARALHDFTGKLPLLKVSDLKFNSGLIGRDTKEALRSGIINYSIYALDVFVSEIEKKFGSKFKVIISGGASGSVLRRLKHSYKYVPDTVLSGINSIMLYNRI